MVLNGGEHSQTDINKSSSSGVGVDLSAGGGRIASSSIAKNDVLDSSREGMDRIQGKLAGMQLGQGGVDGTGGGGGQQHVVAGHSLGPAGAGSAVAGGVPDSTKSSGPYHGSHPAVAGDISSGGGSDLSKSHGGNAEFFAFAPNSMGLGGVEGSGSSGMAGSAAGGPQHPAGMGYMANPANGGSGGQMYKKAGAADGSSGGGSGGSSGRTGGSDVSRRFGVPMGVAGSRNSATSAGNRAGAGAGAAVPGGGVGFGADGVRRGGAGGRRGQGGVGGINGGVGVPAGGRGRVPGVRGYGEGSSPIRGEVEPQPLQVPHMGYGGGSTMSPSSAAMGQGMYAGAGNGAPTGGMGPMGMQSPPVGVGMHHGMGAGSSVHAGGLGGAMGTPLGHMDPSQQALMGQMQSNMYYGGGGYGASMGAQGAGSPGLSHMSQAAGGYPSSPGHGVSYGLQSGQQMGSLEMQQGMASGYGVGAGGMVPNMGVLPGTTNMQSPYGAYWPSADVNPYSGSMSNGVSSYAGGFPANERSVNEAGIRGASPNKNLYQTQQAAAQGGQQRGAADQYGARQPQGYDAGDYARPYGMSSAGVGGAYGPAAATYGFGAYGMAASPKMDGGARDRRRARVRSGSMASASTGFGGPDPQRESELSVATDNLTLEEIEGNVFRMSKDQIGCRLLQLKLDQGDPVFVSKICGEAQPYLSDMMKDPFGNYLFQKIADKIDEAGRTELVNKVADQMVEAGMNLHGTRSVQKVIEVCRNTPSQVELVVSALSDATVTLCLDTNGNHVVQRLLQHLAPADNAFVFEMLAEACVPVATHRHGCCVLQRAMDAATPEQARLLVAQVCLNALQLMQDPYGNYVVQYVLGICTREEADTLVTVPLGKVAMLSMQKFSSNVIEKCMDRASEEVIVKYVHELADPAAMRPLLQDQYANYVIQKTLQLAPREAALILVESIREHLPLMRNSSGGRRMLTKISKRFPEINLDDDLAAPGAPAMEGGVVDG